MARRLQIGLRPGIALFFACVAACWNEPGVSHDARLQLPANLVVGDTPTVRLLEAGRDASYANELWLRLQTQPEGVLERVTNSDGSFSGKMKAVAAGTVHLRLLVPGLVGGGSLTAVSQVACPAVSTDAVQPESGTIVGSKTWNANDGIVQVSGLLTVAGTLEIGACTQVEFGPGAGISVGDNGTAALIVRGTSDNPIIFRGAADGSGGRVRWTGIHLTVANTLSSTALRGMVITDADGWAEPDGSRSVIDVVGDLTQVYPGDHGARPVPFALSAVTITGCADTGIRLRGVFATNAVDWANIQVSGCTGHPLSVDAGSLGAVPTGSFTDNGNPTIEVVGGWAGPNNQVWHQAETGVTNGIPNRIPYYVKNTIVVAAAPPPSLAPSLPVAPEVVHECAFGGLFTIIEAGTEWRFESGTGLYFGWTMDDVGPACNTDADCGALYCLPELGGRCWDFNTLPWVRFVVRGNPVAPVRFTSAKPVGSRQPGDWIGIVTMPNAILGYPNPQDPAFFVSSLVSAIVEFAGAPSGPTYPVTADPRFDKVEGGLTVMSPSWTLPAMGQGALPFQFLSGCVLRYNQGFGLMSAFPVTFAVANEPADYQRSLYLSAGVGQLSFASCACGNTLGAVSPRFFYMFDPSWTYDDQNDRTHPCPETCQIPGMKWVD